MKRNEWVVLVALTVLTFATVGFFLIYNETRCDFCQDTNHSVSNAPGP
jgi:hypothetical protein